MLTATLLMVYVLLESELSTQNKINLSSSISLSENIATLLRI
jgi:hypothetical protein